MWKFASEVCQPSEQEKHSRNLTYVSQSCVLEERYIFGFLHSPAHITRKSINLTVSERTSANANLKLLLKVSEIDALV